MRRRRITERWIWWHLKRSRRSMADMKEKEKNQDNFCVNEEIEEEAGNFIGYDRIGGET
jgi:hypothetical protein